MFSEISFQNRPERATPLSNLLIYQEEFLHDTASLVMPYQPPYSRFADDTPVLIRWGVQPTRSFYGYVYHTEPAIDSGQVKVVCLSASYIMKTALLDSWFNRSTSSVIREVVRRYRFSSSIIDTKDSIETMTANGSTAWQFCVDRAKALGWTMYAPETDFVFEHPLADLDDKMRSAQLVELRKNLRTFSVVSGQLVENGGVKAQRTLYGLDPRMLSQFQVSKDASFGNELGAVNDPATFERYVTTSVSTMAEADVAVDGEQNNNRWYIQASATIDGNPRIRQGQLVFVSGVPKRERGYWYVIRAEHDITEQRYITILTLGRDSTFNNLSVETGVGRRTVRYRTDPFGVKKSVVPASRLVDNVWQATYGLERAS